MKCMRRLKANEVRCYVQYVRANGMARIVLGVWDWAEIGILDEKYGIDNWCCEYKDIGGRLYCGVSVRMSDGSWVSKWDTKEKIAIRWGIGRELCAIPAIWIRLKDEEIYKRGSSWGTETQFWVDHIGYTVKNKSVNRLVIKDDRDIIRYQMGKNNRCDKKEKEHISREKEHISKETLNLLARMGDKIGCKDKLRYIIQYAFGHTAEEMTEAEGADLLARMDYYYEQYERSL